MSTTISISGRFLKTIAAAAAVTVTLGAATLSTAAPAEARPFHHGFHHGHFGFHPGYRHFGYGFRPYGYGFRHHAVFHRPVFRYGYGPIVHRHVFHRFALVGVPGYGWGYHPHHFRGCAPFAWHHRYAY